MSSQRNDPPIVEIAQARAADLPALNALLAYCGLTTMVVARAGQHLVGCAGLECYGIALLRSVAVAPHLTPGCAWASSSSSPPSRLFSERGIAMVYLLTETAQGFFPRIGFTAIECAEVPPALHESAEWTTVCASTAQAMAKQLPAEL